LVNSVFASHLSILSVKLCTYEGFVKKDKRRSKKNLHFFLLLLLSFFTKPSYVHNLTDRMLRWLANTL
jgi:hypothetical protein